jgi:hypothetical protein
MIPLFTPATARKDVNKTQGDGELAKLANLNRLVENVNTIVAEGIPAADPTLTFTTVGAINTLIASILTQITAADSASTGGTKVAQSRTLPYITADAGSLGNGNAETVSSITFPGITLLGSISLDGYLNLTTINLPSVVRIFGNFEFYNLTSLTTLSAPNLVSAEGPERIIQGATSLQSLSLPSYTSLLTITDAPALTSVVLSDTVFNLDITDAPLLTTVSSDASTVSLIMTEDTSTVGITNLTSTNFPNVTNLKLQGYKGTTLSFPLVTVFGVSIYNDISTLTINLPSVTTITVFEINNTSLTSITVPPTVVNINSGDVAVAYNSSLTSLSLGVIGTLKRIDDTQLIFTENALNVASVNGILALLVSLDGTNGTTLFGPGRNVQLVGGTNAAPTGQGLIDKATLQARGVTIDTN